MLTYTQRDIIKATVPLLQTGGEMLVKHFYEMMLREYPHVRPLFNQSHQTDGTQQRALANGMLLYARYIDRLEALGPLASQIVNKHVSLQIQPEHYPIVGTCLLRAIREVLGMKLATEAVMEAWRAAYQQLADMLIDAERQAYDAIASAPGGWYGARLFRVTKKIRECAEITSFYLEPTDGGPVVQFTPGQYIGVRLIIDGVEVRRNYSLSAAPNDRGYRISVKRELGGLASRYLHDRVPIGSTLELFPPAGNFTLTQNDRRLVLISGGVGITPTLAMAEATLRSDRPITFIHYARNWKVHAFGELLHAWRCRYPQLRSYIVYEKHDTAGSRRPDAVGRPDLAQLKQWLPEDCDYDAYYVGPKPFMAYIKWALHDLGLADERSRYEFFGPAETLN